ncbi:MAG: hypothetical protein P4L69_14525, partial [Desulfosporosinus sp.]|nr:hypothetical protein [Desulfosporosinus sp.]
MAATLPHSAEEALEMLELMNKDLKESIDFISEPIDGNSIKLYGRALFKSEDRCYFFISIRDQPVEITGMAKQCSNIVDPYNNALNFVQMQDGTIVVSRAFHGVFES